MKRLRDELDLQRKTGSPSRGEEWPDQYADTWSQVIFADIKNYFEDIMFNNLAAIKSLKWLNCLGIHPLPYAFRTQGIWTQPSAPPDTTLIFIKILDVDLVLTSFEIHKWHDLYTLVESCQAVSPNVMLGERITYRVLKQSCSRLCGWLHGQLSYPLMLAGECYCLSMRYPPLRSCQRAGWALVELSLLVFRSHSATGYSHPSFVFMFCGLAIW